jgi:hypothetical protein
MEIFHWRTDSIYNILQRLNTVTIVEQLAICEALTTLPSYRHDVYQYVRQSQCSTSPVTFIQIYLSNERDNNTENESTSQALFEKCLTALEVDSLALLTVEAASVICIFLSTSITEIDTLQITRIEQALLKKISIKESASPCVVTWLNHRCDKVLYSLPYYIVLY